jgi:hypothetical protein
MLWQSGGPETKWRNIPATSYSGLKVMKDFIFFLLTSGRQERGLFFLLFPQHEQGVQ